MEIGSVDFHWDITDALQLKSITSYTEDTSTGQSPQNFPVTLFVHPGTARIVTPGLPNIAVPTGSGFNPNITSRPNGLGLGALIRTNTHNQRNVLSQEVRLASSPDRARQLRRRRVLRPHRACVTQYAEASDLGFRQFSGMSIAQRYGVPFTGFFSNISESIQDWKPPRLAMSPCT